MKKSFAIRTYLHLPDNPKLHDLVKIAEAGDNDRSFVLQVYRSGYAVGLCLNEKDSREFKKLIKPFWDKANKPKATSQQ